MTDSTSPSRADVRIAVTDPDHRPPAVLSVLRVEANGIAATQSDAPLRLPELANPDARLHTELLDRWRRELAPCVATGLRGLAVSVAGWTVHVRALDAAASHEQACMINGPSADAAAFVAMVASALGLRVRRDAVICGGVEAAREALTPVGQLPDKLRAASLHKGVRRFIHPAIDEDGSLAWTPEVYAAWLDACTQNEGRLRSVACGTLGELLGASIPVDERLCLSLRTLTAPLEGADWARRLVRGDRRRWERRVQARLQAGQARQAKRLLDAWVGVSLRDRRYPIGLGRWLTGCLWTVPAVRRRTALQTALLEPRLLKQCRRLATKRDRGDLRQLRLAVQGRLPNVSAHDSSPKATDQLAALLDERLNRAPRALRQPLDRARLTYRPGCFRPQTYDAFLDEITAAYAHLLAADGVQVGGDPRALVGEASGLVEQAYAREGGVTAAYAQARHARQGSLRDVLDRMTDTLIARRLRANALVQQTLATDPADPNSDRDLMASLLAAYRPMLPASLRQLTPEEALAGGDLSDLIDEVCGSAERFAARLNR